MHADKCPVCEGCGEVWREDNSEVWYNADGIQRIDSDSDKQEKESIPAPWCYMAMSPDYNYMG